MEQMLVLNIFDFLLCWDMGLVIMGLCTIFISSCNLGNECFIVRVRVGARARARVGMMLAVRVVVMRMMSSAVRISISIGYPSFINSDTIYY